MTISHTHERTYRKLIGPLGKKPTITAECFFVDPIADIAVLGPPDNQACYDECHGYEEFIENLGALPIGGILRRHALALHVLGGEMIRFEEEYEQEHGHMRDTK
jgi:hypothetical protein